jgi:cytochrome c-type biogenesis protein
MGGDVTLLVAFSAGVLSFLSPCVLPLFPSYLSFITGMSVDQLRGVGVDRAKVAGHSLAFIVGFSLVFVAMGASLSALGQLLFDHRDLIRWIGGGLMIVFGLYVAGLVPVAWLGRDRRIELGSKPAGFVGSWLVGVTFAIGWTPCVGPILGAILSLAGAAETLTTGVALLAAYSAGLALPFFLSSLALGSFLGAFQRFRPYLPLVERTAGALLILVGVLVVTNHLVVLNSYAISLTPAWLLRLL